MGNGGAGPAVVKVWIFQKGNGQLRVDPSPFVVRQGDSLQFINLTGTPAEARFEREQYEGAAPVVIKPGRNDPSVRIVANPGTYIEYDVTIGNTYADGGSKPGGIVDP